MTLLDHSSSLVRIGALSHLAGSKAATVSFSDAVLMRLKETLPAFHCEVDPKSRNTFVHLVEILITKISRAAYFKPDEVRPSQIEQYSVAENKMRPRQPTNDVYERHIFFLRWYTVFLAKELQPTASYQRHITALGVLKHLQSRDSENRLTSIWYSSVQLGRIGQTTEPPGSVLLVRPLLDLLMDPFDDVRASAVLCLWGILTSQPTNPHEPNGEIRTASNSPLSTLIDTSEEPTDLAISKSDFDRHHKLFQRQARTSGRADHADGFARSFELLWRLLPRHWTKDGEHGCAAALIIEVKKWIKDAKKDIHVASRTSPLHGNLSALR